jgi:hypothetical protein
LAEGREANAALFSYLGAKGGEAVAGERRDVSSIT